MLGLPPPPAWIRPRGVDFAQECCSSDLAPGKRVNRLDLFFLVASSSAVSKVEERSSRPMMFELPLDVTERVLMGGRVYTKDKRNQCQARRLKIASIRHEESGLVMCGIGSDACGFLSSPSPTSDGCRFPQLLSKRLLELAATRRAEDCSPLGSAIQKMIPCSWEVHPSCARH
jgi:hypothetical protein